MSNTASCRRLIRLPRALAALAVLGALAVVAPVGTATAEAAEAATTVAAASLGLPVAGVPDVIPPPAPGSTLLGCAAADVRADLSGEVHLDPSCDYTAGFEITTSGVTLDCQGAHVSKPGGGAVIEVHTPIDVDLHDVTIRNCEVSGGTNGIKSTRDGFRTLTEGDEWHHTLRDVVIEDSAIGPTGGVGIFVDGYVEHVTIRHVSVIGAGSTGIYLDGGSRRNTIESNVLHDNGYTENGRPEGQITVFGGTRFRWWGTGREGLAIDGSSENVVTGNHLEGNQAGGIFLYTNCGEFVHENPARWYDRRTPSDDNLLEGNTFVGGIHGVWVASRMGENTLPMDCSKPAYATGPFQRYVLDTAANNTVRGNDFHDVVYGIQVEDDGTTVQGNTFSGPDPSYHAVVIGTRVRTDALGHPVTGTVLRANRSDIVGNTHPYRWVHGHEGTVDQANLALGRRPTELCEGRELPHNSLIFVYKAVPEPLGSPPTPKPDFDIPVLGALPPCGALAATVPAPPTGAAAVGGVGSVHLSWQPPDDDGGAPLEGYDVLDERGAVVASTTADVTEADVPAAPADPGPSFTVRARNAVGPSDPSDPTAPVAVTAASVDETTTTTSTTAPGPATSGSSTTTTASGGASMTSTTVTGSAQLAGAPATATQTGQLPVTGSDVGARVALALALVLAGTAITALSARRRST